MTHYDADLIGIWTYGRQSYEIQFDDGVGKYLFIQRSTGAEGALESTGVETTPRSGREWIEGHVKLGTIRVKLTEEGSLLSQFKTDDQSEWQPAIVARKYFENTDISSVASATVAPSVCEMLGNVRPLVFLALLVATGIPAVCTVLCTSDLTPLGSLVYSYLVRSYVNSSNVDLDLYHIFLLMGTAMIFLGYLFDVYRWAGAFKLAALAYFKVAALCFLFGALFYTKAMPSIPLIIGIAVSILSAVLVRHLYDSEPVDTFALSTSMVFLMHSITCAVIWLLWAFTLFMGGLHKWESDESMDRNERLMKFIRWSSPMLLSMAYFLVFGITLTMSRFLRATNQKDIVDVGELKVVLGSIASCFFLAWIACTLLVYSMDLSKVVIRLAVVWFIGTMLYVALQIGFGRIRKAIQNSSNFELMVWFMDTDWFRGLFLLMSWPFLPVYFAIEILHKLIRTEVSELGLTPTDPGAEKVTDWLTGRAWQLWQEMTVVWDKGQALLCSMYLGIIFFLVQVCFVFGLTLFLSWIGEKMAPLPLWSIVLGMYLMGLVLFLLPPCPGTPVYLLAAMIITSRCMQDSIGGSEEIGFWLGILGAILFCFVLKMSAIIMEQKAIGEPFSENVDVKKLIGVQKEQIKSVRHILKQPGMSIEKVAILVGGPDWPTSVLTGILRLRVADMLLGSSPVIFIIIPVVLAAAFQVRAGQDHPNAHMYQSMATILMMIATLVQLGAFMLAGYYMQVVADEHREEMSDFEQDDQQDEVMESLDLETQRSRILVGITGWKRMPTWLRFLLFVGSICASFMLHIVIAPFIHPFREFTFTDSWSDLGGNLTSLINRAGWWAISLFCTVVSIVAMHQIWCKMKTRGLSEQVPITPNDARRPSAYARAGSICSQTTPSRGRASSNGSIIVGTYSTMREGD